MKTLSEKQALVKLRKLKDDYRNFIKEDYEHRAKDCGTCETKGACCLDAHFVNVHITKLEAVLINQELEKLAPAKQKEIGQRITETIKQYDLTSDGDTFQKTFACPLFEKGIGCLIHTVKPVPCIQHACYDRAEDLPPDELQVNVEQKIHRINQQTYGNVNWSLLPVELQKL